MHAGVEGRNIAYHERPSGSSSPENLRQASRGAGAVQAPIAAYPNFERLEAEGERLMPEQLKAMPMALAQSSLRLSDSRFQFKAALALSVRP